MNSFSGKLDIVQLLLDHGADINKTNSIGKTAIQLASFVGNYMSFMTELNANSFSFLVFT